jgi:hypothetical protein
MPLGCCEQCRSIVERLDKMQARNVGSTDQSDQPTAALVQR